MPFALICTTSDQEVAEMKRICLGSVALAAMLAVGCNKNHGTSETGDATTGTSGRAAANVSGSDKNFVRDVSRLNAAEIDLARLALTRSSSPDVKKFAQMMVDEHTAAGDKLNGVASQDGIEVAAQIDDSHHELHDKLAARQGLDFDRDYADAMVDDHAKLVDTLESRIDKDTLSKWKSDVKDPATGERARVEGRAETVLPEKSDDPVTQRLNAWAADTYPTAYAHLVSARVLKDAAKKRSTD